VIPFVEANYRTGPPRYLAGHSTGAIHTRNIGLRNPEAFSALGIFFGGGISATDPPLEQTYPKLLDAGVINDQLRLIYIALGKDAPLATPNVERLRASFERLGIRHEFYLSSGGQTPFNWQRCLPEFLQRLPKAK
jgi:enterochelin esterase-like enzyme